MAFPSAPGYGNLPRGNFSPVIYSRKTLKFFKTASVADEVTNTEFEGEIRDYGDTVRITKEPEVEIYDYKRGQEGQDQDLDDEDTQLTIDQAKVYRFKQDDIEKRQSHVSYESLAVGSAAYGLRNTFDKDVLGNMLANATVATSTGTDAAPVQISYGAGRDFTPYDLLIRLERFMDENDVPDDGGRFVIAAPRFYEAMKQEDSKLIDSSVTGDPKSYIRDSKLASKAPIGSLRCYKTNNAPLSAGNGNFTVIAGHRSATATASQILTSETLRSDRFFGDIYRGLFVYGRKVLRPEALFAAHITY